ncbi:MAG: diacylglycerol kinase family protein [Gammaproteobacteria bacterium]|nr:diacylglycerol kinase family protein [Gammaproteobacteria bacterium]
MPDHRQGPFRLRARLGSLGHALAGVALVLRTQHNAWVHAAASVLVVIAGAFSGIDVNQWCWLVVAIALVFVCETLNTAIELLCDVASPEFHPLVKMAKDAAAGAVLIAALCATIIGALVLGPRLLQMLG